VAGQRPAAMHGAPPDWTRRNLSAGSGVPRVDTSSSAISVFTLSAGVSPAGVWLASPYSCGAPLHSDILSYLVRPFQKVGVAQAPVGAQRWCASTCRRLSLRGNNRTDVRGTDCVKPGSKRWWRQRVSQPATWEPLLMIWFTDVLSGVRIPPLSPWRATSSRPPTR